MKKKSLLTKDNKTDILNTVKWILSDYPLVEQGTLLPMVQNFLHRRNDFLNLTKKYPTPFYILDKKELTQSIAGFKAAFAIPIPRLKIYFAMKTNHHPVVLNTLVEHGIGLDVSSVREFMLAKESGCKDMIFTGPGKTEEDLLYVLRNGTNVIVQMDSFGELERLGKVAKRLEIKVKAGVRIYTSTHKQWSKFGIALNELKTFWKEAKKYEFIDLAGIQFHLSWNENATPYQKAIKELGDYLKSTFTEQERSQIQFIDFGGGFRPYKSEGTYPWLTPQGIIIKTAHEFVNKKTVFSNKYFISPSIPIGKFANGIGNAIRKYLSPFVSCDYFTEPGRIISNNSMHIALQVVDKKSTKSVIMDGGINMIGYERFEYDYFPLINLSHPSLTEHTCTLYGNLCMPDDLWGYYYYGESINEGDTILVPYQGCLTYSLAQNFIRPIPPVYILE